MAVFDISRDNGRMKLNRTEQADRILGNLVRAIEMLHNCPEFSYLISEIRVNIVYALPGAETPEEIAAIDGRITSVRGFPHASGMPRWGASTHIANVVLRMRKFDAAINAGMNFKYDPAIKEVVQQYASEQGMLFGWIDRSGEEPLMVIERDGASTPWKMEPLVAKYGGMPRLFFTKGGLGREPIFVALGSDATEVAGIAVEIAKRYKQRKS